MIAHALALGKRSVVGLRYESAWRWSATARTDDQFDQVFYVTIDGLAGIAIFPRVHAMPGDTMTIDFQKAATHKKFFR